MNEINGKNKLSVLLNERDGPITSQNKKDLSHTQITEEVNQRSSKDKTISPTFTFIKDSYQPGGNLITYKNFMSSSVKN